MHELTYRSKARPAITQREVEDIIAVSRRRNLEMNISGCLIFHKNVFIQIIEGVEKDVLALFDKIRSDIRHSEIELLWEGSCHERVFADWQMAVYSLQGKVSPSELTEFENNLLLFSKFAEKPTASVNLFWKNVTQLLAPSISKKYSAR